MASKSTTPGLSSEGGSARLLWFIATAENPLTMKEIAEQSGANYNNVNSTVHNLFRSGYLARRKRENGGHGPDPYEYAVRARGEDDD